MRTIHHYRPRDAVHPYDNAFREASKGLPRLTTEDCLRVLRANRFRDPFFGSSTGGMDFCTVTGPDEQVYDAAQVLQAIIKAERLERLCQDRSDAVLGILNREGGWQVFHARVRLK